ncbi:hypothetical protein CA85_39830 [Allorhodopirellula solitaria]|uniref:Uncharacterized protein n=1 Tax=Allorhodopirellula solitaria TaxID=2527987 RepID=A0A5C5X824_9BACT|nr:hypothetical protein CA85_39830 [Allorhodopirellula solitaria]
MPATVVDEATSPCDARNLLPRFCHTRSDFSKLENRGIDNRIAHAP